MLLSRLFIIAMLIIITGFPAGTNAAQVEIFVVKTDAGVLAAKLKTLTPKQGLDAIKSIKRRALSGIPNETKRYTVVFVVKKKLRVGTKIFTKHQFVVRRPGRRDKYYRAREFNYTIEDDTSYSPLVILNTTWGGGRKVRPFFGKYSIYVDDNKLKERIIGIGH